MRDGLSENTVISYLKTIQQFNSMYKTISLQNIYSYKGFLIENYKVKTVNLRIQALNKYLEFKNINESLKLLMINQGYLSTNVNVNLLLDGLFYKFMKGVK